MAVDDRPGVLDLLLVCPGGSSVAQLAALDPWSRAHRRWWVSSPTPDALATLRGERVCWSLRAADDAPRSLRRPLDALLAGVDLGRNLGLARRVLRAGRPDVVLATGAASAVPFFLLARLLRVPTVYLESGDRTDPATTLDRVCRRLAGRMLVQWEDQAELYPDVDVVGCLL